MPADNFTSNTIVGISIFCLNVISFDMLFHDDAFHDAFRCQIKLGTRQKIFNSSKSHTVAKIDSLQY